MNQVVITGIGVVSPIGFNARDFRSALKDGRAGEPATREFGANGRMISEKVLALNHFDPPKYASILDPHIQYILRASEEALQDAGLDPAQIDRSRLGIAVSSSKGGMVTLERFYGRFQKHPSALLGARVYANLIPNIAAQWVARHWKITGPAKPAVAACATGLYAVMEGVRMIEQEEVDWCLAGAGDASITSLMVAGYRAMGVLSRDVTRPFDKRRDGFLLGEGAGIVLLENAVEARARGARSYGRVLAHRYGFEGSHPISFAQNGEGLSHCLRQVVGGAKITPKDIDYVNLHGTATRDGDRYETTQIKIAFGKEAYTIPMSSTKSMTGHMLGASGAVGLIASLVAMRDGFLPPTANLTQPDPACDLDYTPIRAKKKSIGITCSISMGFGGQLGAVIVGK